MVYHAVIACGFCLHLIHVWTYTIKASWHQISYFCGLSSVALFLVMSKAFDKVPHHHLLCSLSVISISGPLLKWFELKLYFQSFSKVVLNGYSSTSLPVSHNSILGSLLFITYINSLHFSSGSTIILYADDILLYRPLWTSQDTFQLDMDLISNWITSSGLRLIWQRAHSWLSPGDTETQLSITINTTPVTIVEWLKYLGVTTGNGSPIITKTSKSAKQKLGLLYCNFQLTDQ